MRKPGFKSTIMAIAIVAGVAALTAGAILLAFYSPLILYISLGTIAVVLLTYGLAGFIEAERMARARARQKEWPFAVTLDTPGGMHIRRYTPHGATSNNALQKLIRDIAAYEVIHSIKLEEDQ